MLYDICNFLPSATEEDGGYINEDFLDCLGISAREDEEEETFAPYWEEPLMD